MCTGLVDLSRPNPHVSHGVFGVSVSMTSPRSIITNGRGTLSISESSTEMVRQSEGKAAGTAAWIDTTQTPHTFFHTVLYAHSMTYKYDENRIDAEKLRFLLKSVKSYIIGKIILCKYCMYSVRKCSFGDICLLCRSTVSHAGES
jgi:hypothetical protein